MMSQSPRFEWFEFEWVRWDMNVGSTMQRIDVLLVLLLSKEDVEGGGGICGATGSPTTKSKDHSNLGKLYTVGL